MDLAVPLNKFKQAYESTNKACLLLKLMIYIHMYVAKFTFPVFAKTKVHDDEIFEEQKVQF